MHMFLHHQVTVVDDFYPEPDRVRELALGLPAESSSGGNYPGCMTTEGWFDEHHQRLFYQLTGSKLESATAFNGRFRFTPKDSIGKQHIHFDPGNGVQWAGVIYLQKPEHYGWPNENGTSFWKHRRTGLSSIPLDQEGIEKYGWGCVQDLVDFLESDGLNEDLWEQVQYVPYRYNRLVLFRPWMFHSGGGGFGTDKEDCRILQTFFLR